MNLTADALSKYNQQRPQAAQTLPCWSPVKSMYIGMRGKVTSCCYNRIYTIGNYPDNTLHEIWFGERRLQLMRSISNNDFSLGCLACKELIEVGNYSGLPAKNFDHLPRNEKGYPTKIDFELSNECNLECVMCRGEFSSAIRKNREKLPAIPSPYDQAFIRQLEEFIPHLISSHFLGGEPLLIPIYLEIWETISKINPSVKLSIQTNGSILSNRIKQILESMSFDISVSIDSVEKDNYERIRKNAKYDTVINNINYFREYCKRKKTNFNFAYCPMTVNWHEIPAMIAFANELDTEVFFTTVNFPKALSFESLSFEELLDIESTLQKAHYAQETAVGKKNYETVKQLIKHIAFWKSEAGNKTAFQPKNLEEYMQGLSDYLDAQKTTDKYRLLEDIQSKLSYLVHVAAQNGMEKQAEGKIIEVNYKTVTEMLPGVDREHLLHLFKSFIMPL